MLSAGSSKLKKLADNITPALNPKRASKVLLLILFTRNTGKAPSPVARPANKLAINPKNIILSDIARMHPL